MIDPSRWPRPNTLRHHLLFAYAAEPSSPSDVARRLQRPLNLVSYHTRVLFDHGFLELARTERRRGGTARVYFAVVSPVIEDDAWIELPEPVRRMLVASVLRAVADASRAAALDGGFDAATSHLSRWPLRLDDDARGDVARVLRRLLDDLAAIQAASDRRSAPERRHIDVVLLGFRSGDTPA